MKTINVALGSYFAFYFKRIVEIIIFYGQLNEDLFLKGYDEKLHL